VIRLPARSVARSQRRWRPTSAGALARLGSPFERWMNVMNNLTVLALVFAVLSLAAAAVAQEPGEEEPRAKPGSAVRPKTLFAKLLGKWEGQCRTWFEPGKLADESRVAGEFVGVLDGRFVRHVYTGMIQGKPRHGEELIAFNAVTKRFQSSWVDDFHMNQAIMFSEGEGLEQGFEVHGRYDVGEDQPPWGWRTEYELVDDDHLTITAYNIHPKGMEAKAVETRYQRVK